MDIFSKMFNDLSSWPGPIELKRVFDYLKMTTEQRSIVLNHILSKNENSELTIRWRKQISFWDKTNGVWAKNTDPNTKARRELIIEILKIENTSLGESLKTEVPLNEPSIRYACISENKDQDDWVSLSNFPTDGLWESYKNFLIRKKWPEKSIEILDDSTNGILNRITNPNWFQKKPNKGLVIGYVQSGKTANFTALIAKAVDVGYKFIVVLSGRSDILRNQTQARLDMELLGWHNLNEAEKGSNDFKDGTSYLEKRFIVHKRPIDFCRLTVNRRDFNSGSISAIFPSEKPVIAILKKNPKRLQDFAIALDNGRWKKVPLLLIDDEADEASVNTNKNSKCISKIAGLINRVLNISDFGQYVGYTATPYANVFIRPEESKELFPSDFVISLCRPQNYMGALEFFDLGDGFVNDSTLESNERAFIRVIEPNEMEDFISNPFAEMPKLLEAIDAFILAGAIKLWRQDNSNSVFKHHTMLINTDRLKKAHSDLAFEVESLLKKYYPEKKVNLTSQLRLKHLWENDFSKISKIRSEGVPSPQSFDEVKEFVNISLKRIFENIKVVNCENEDDTPNFEAPSGCWAILIGGSKLSRGYTIEGLTISYFSRKPGQMDTLVQMARWYGFRPSFKDLVRLYIPRELPPNNKKTFNKTTKSRKAGYPLLDVFRFSAKVEESFRNNLIDYRKDLKPNAIPPFVQYQFEDFPDWYRKIVKPTASNKMFHTTFEATFIGGKVNTVTRIASKQKFSFENKLALENLLKNCERGLKKSLIRFYPPYGDFEISTGIVSTKSYLEFLEETRFYNQDLKKPNVVQEQLDALKQMNLSSWRIVFFWPQDFSWMISLGKFKLPRWGRNYKLNENGIVYDSPGDVKQLDICRWLAQIDTPKDLNSSDDYTLSLRSEERGVLYIIPFKRISNPPEEDWYFLWSAVFPGSGRAGAYRVRTHR